MRKELFGTGLEPPRTRAPLLAWGFGCWWISNSVAVVINDWNPLHAGSYRWKLRQFQTLDELDREVTICV
jgi:hypothetical protein